MPRPLKGLILAGGYSTRMGRDKSMISYHGMPQYRYLYELLDPLVEKVFISCRPEQSAQYDLPCIADQYQDAGPIAGVLSAFLTDPHCAWMVVACDLIHLHPEALRELVSSRDPQKEATYFIDPASGFPEPLCTIYEPAIYPLLKASFSEEQFSLNKIVQRCDGRAILPSDAGFLRSINAPDEIH